MKQFILSERALRDYEALTPALQRRMDKQLAFLLQNFLHPSLRSKKYDEGRNVWQARVNDDYRFYFTIYGDTYAIVTIRKHPK